MVGKILFPKKGFCWKSNSYNQSIVLLITVKKCIGIEGNLAHDLVKIFRIFAKFNNIYILYIYIQLLKRVLSTQKESN